MELEAYAYYLMDSKTPIPDALPQLTAHFIALIEETRRAKWLGVLAETELDTVPRPPGWEIDIADVFERETVPAAGRVHQAMIDLLLGQVDSTPGDEDLIVEAAPEVSREDVHGRYMERLQRLLPTAGQDGGKLKWNEMARRMRIDVADLFRARKNTPKIPNHRVQLYRFIDQLESER